METSERERTSSRFDAKVLLTMPARDRELLDELTTRLGISQTEVVIRALHLCNSLQNRAQGY